MVCHNLPKIHLLACEPDKQHPTDQHQASNQRETNTLTARDLGGRQSVCRVRLGVDLYEFASMGDAMGCHISPGSVESSTQRHSAQAIRNWVRQAERKAGRREDSVTSAEREELRRENRQLREERKWRFCCLPKVNRS